MVFFFVECKALECKKNLDSDSMDTKFEDTFNETDPKCPFSETPKRPPLQLSAAVSLVAAAWLMEVPEISSPMGLKVWRDGMDGWMDGVLKKFGIM